MRQTAIVLLLIAAGCTGEPAHIENRGSEAPHWTDALPRPEWRALDRIAADEPWFEIYRAAPGVLAIYEPGHFEEVISYLVVGGATAVLFDTGLGIGDMRALVDHLTSLDVLVVNSHTHYDHVGGNHAFDRIAAFDSPFARRNADGHSAAELAFAVADGWIARPTPAGFDPKTYHGEPFTITRYLTDGATIDLGGRILEVVAVPGHSPDSIALIDRDARLILTGDAFYLAPLYAHLEGSSMPDYVTTAHRLAGMADAVDVLLPGHNVTRVDPKYLVRMAAAFDAITDGTVSFDLADGVREYRFDGFSVLAPNGGN